jgi:hypothetical protein
VRDATSAWLRSLNRVLERSESPTHVSPGSHSSSTSSVLCMPRDRPAEDVPARHEPGLLQSLAGRYIVGIAARGGDAADIVANAFQFLDQVRAKTAPPERLDDLLTPPGPNPLKIQFPSSWALGSVQLEIVRNGRRGSGQCMVHLKPSTGMRRMPGRRNLQLPFRELGIRESGAGGRVWIGTSHASPFSCAIRRCAVPCNQPRKLSPARVHVGRRRPLL